MNTGTHSTQAQVHGLQAQIRAVRGKRKKVRTATGLAFGLAVLVGVFAVEMTMDFLVELPWIARAFAFVGAVGGSFLWLWRDTIQPLRKPLSEDDVAGIIEHALPAFRTRFIASIQLARAAAGQAHSHLLIDALIAETARLAAMLDFGKVIKITRLLRGLRFAWCVVVVAFGLAWLGGEASPVLLQRALLSSVDLPRKTHIEWITGNKKIGVGEDLKIEVIASGVLPPGGRVIANIEGKPQREFALEHDPVNREKYSALVHSPQESFTYSVKLNDATSATYNVETTARPSVVDVACVQTYPSYIDLPRVKRNVGDLTLLAGSRLKVMITANVKIYQGRLHLEGLNKDAELKVDPKDRTKLTGEFEIPAKDLTGFSVRLENMDRVASGESATYRIDLMPDREPTVKMIRPVRRDSLSTPQANMKIIFEAKDDFGVVEAVLHYMIDQGEEKAITFDLRGSIKNVHDFEWNLGTLQPRITVGNTIEFWITVADGNTLTGPGIGTTEHYQTKVVTADELQLAIQNGMKETYDLVNDIKTEQGAANSELGDFIFEKPRKNP